jgi:hypothetical protein
MKDHLSPTEVTATRKREQLAHLLLRNTSSNFHSTRQSSVSGLTLATSAERRQDRGVYRRDDGL